MFSTKMLLLDAQLDSRHRNDDMNQLSALILFVTILLSQTKIKNLNPVILYL